VNEQTLIASKLYQVNGVIDAIDTTPSLRSREGRGESTLAEIKDHFEKQLHPECKKLIEQWPSTIKNTRLIF